MVHSADLEAWFVTSQHLYGADVLKTLQQRADTIAKVLAASSEIPVKILPKPVVTGSESIQKLCLDSSTGPDKSSVPTSLKYAHPLLTGNPPWKFMRYPSEAKQIPSVSFSPPPVERLGTTRWSIWEIDFARPSIVVNL
jgi:hypothetical protein